jgi:hypothetical protein
MLHAYRSNESESEKIANQALLGFCQENTSFEEVKATTSDLLRWSSKNYNLVKPSFLKNSKIKKRFEYFEIPFDVDVESLPTKEEAEYQEFIDKWDKAAELEICFCHWRLHKNETKDPEINKYCEISKPFISKIFIISVISGTTIAMANFFILKFVPVLIKKIPMENLTKRENLVVMITLLFLYINSVMAPIFIHSADFLNFFREDEPIIKHSKLPYIIKFYDIEHQWYEEVGVKITLSFLANLIFCTVFEFTRVKIDYR